VGLFVKDLRYFGSQSWPFPIIAIFTAGVERRDQVRPQRIAERWFGPGDKLPDLSPPVDLARVDRGEPTQAKALVEAEAQQWRRCPLP
jgi:NADH pyrophosphatase NudC (nudix superfamily)